MDYFVGVDTGGTFTDVVILDAAGNLTFDKAFSTPQRPALGVIAALENAVRPLSRELGPLLQRTGRFAHGTTVATNALIQRKGARVGLLMTRGFEDTLLLGRGPMARNLGIPPSQAMDFIHTERPDPLVPKALSRGVAERVAADGRVLAPLREEDVVAALGHFRAEGVESVAVCLLWSFKHPAHEERVKAILGRLAPDILVTLSCEVSPFLGEFERATTAAVNAYIGPVLIRYVRDLQSELEARGLARPVQLMKCSGGLTLPERIEREAVALVNSGPVGGLVAARYLGRVLGHDNVITTDMGGTSFDVGVIYRGEFEEERTPFVGQGLPLQVPAARVVTIGAGGGSIAWTDGRRLMVGPQSAGAAPGPACYDRGGTEPTVTDALVALGLLDPDYFFGGRMRLSRSRAEEAIRGRVAGPLGLDVREAAAGIYEIVTAKMSDLIRKVTVESGFDPREFVVFAYGGASPAHAALYGHEVGVREVIVPHAAPVFSALGVALADLLYTFARSEPMPLIPDPAVLERFNAIFEALERQAHETVAASGFRADEAVLSRKLDLRYEGQMNEITVPWQPGRLTEGKLPEVRRVFEEAYGVRFGRATARGESLLEVITFRVEALRVAQKPHLHAERDTAADPAGARKGVREVWLRPFGAFAAQVYDFDGLGPGSRLAGPAIIERRDTTAFIPPGFEARVDGYRNLRIFR
ncbi:MAG TPA: hydantoinase/oxoprolinase family protein [Candidatus Sulfotelmatobacter sp.]|nr:hydantoinase/oxoprolinase family protein [Candidatus Sulfotelmatobacter sp.]